MNHQPARVFANIRQCEEEETNICWAPWRILDWKIKNSDLKWRTSLMKIQGLEFRFFQPFFIHAYTYVIIKLRTYRVGLDCCFASLNCSRIDGCTPLTADYNLCLADNQSPTDFNLIPYINNYTKVHRTHLLKNYKTKQHATFNTVKIEQWPLTNNGFSMFRPIVPRFFKIILEVTTRERKLVSTLVWMSIKLYDECFCGLHHILSCHALANWLFL